MAGISGATKSKRVLDRKGQEKLTVALMPFDRYGGKTWVKVNFAHGGEWVPSFEDIYWIVRALCYCEDAKYPHGKGRVMVQEFLADCCNKDARWNDLAKKYNIPIRPVEPS